MFGTNPWLNIVLIYPYASWPSCRLACPLKHNFSPSPSYRFSAQTLPFTCSPPGQLHPDPWASLVAPFPVQLSHNPHTLFSWSHQNHFLPCWDPVHYTPAGGVFCQWQEYGILPSPPLSFPPSLPHSFLRNLPALKAADRPERCRPEGLTVCQPTTSTSTPRHQPPLCSKI